jgi:hypothetical protein
LVCPPSGNMARKQCFLVCPPSGNMARKQYYCNNVPHFIRFWCFSYNLFSGHDHILHLPVQDSKNEEFRLCSAARSQISRCVLNEM